MTPTALELQLMVKIKGDNCKSDRILRSSTLKIIKRSSNLKNSKMPINTSSLAIGAAASTQSISQSRRSLVSQPSITSVNQTPITGFGMYRGLPVCLASSYNSAGFQPPYISRPPPSLNYPPSFSTVLASGTGSTPFSTASMPALNLNTPNLGVCGSCSCSFSNPVERIACVSCPLKFHASQMCVGLPIEIVNNIIQYRISGLSYNCTLCRMKPSSDGSSDSQLISAFGQLFESVKGITSVVQNLSVQVSSLVSDFNSKPANTNSLPNSSSSGSASLDNRSVIRQEVREQQERSKRKFSIIVRGIEASNADDFSSKFKILSQSLIGSDALLSNIYCIDVSKHLYRANILNSDIRTRLLDNAKNLRNTGYNNVYVNRDLTYIQRQELRERRARQLVPVSSAVTISASAPSINSIPIMTSTITPSTHVMPSVSTVPSAVSSAVTISASAPSINSIPIMISTITPSTHVMPSVSTVPSSSTTSIPTSSISTSTSGDFLGF